MKNRWVNRIKDNLKTIYHGKQSMKDQWIKEIVKGKTFADIGGLWGTKNEKVSLAVQSGAKAATMIDAAPPDNEMWQAFKDHCVDLNISGYHCLHADVTDQHLGKSIGAYDLIHCSGVIYHLPDPFLMLRNLYSVVNESLILTSMTVPNRIETKIGTIEFSGGTVLSVPLLSQEQKEIFSLHFESEGIVIGAINGDPVEEWVTSDGLSHYGPWWWLWTPDFVKNMLETCRFEVIDVCESWQGKSHSFLCRRR